MNRPIPPDSRIGRFESIGGPRAGGEQRRGTRMGEDKAERAATGDG